MFAQNMKKIKENTDQYMFSNLFISTKRKYAAKCVVTACELFMSTSYVKLKVCRIKSVCGVFCLHGNCNKWVNVSPFSLCVLVSG